MAKKTTETGPSITYHTFAGTATMESATDRSIIETTASGNLTFTFQDDTTILITSLAGARYVLSSDVKAVTSSMVVNMF